MTIHLHMCILAINTIAKKQLTLFVKKKIACFCSCESTDPTQEKKIDIAVLINKLSLIQGQRHGEGTECTMNDRQVQLADHYTTIEQPRYNANTGAINMTYRK